MVPGEGITGVAAASLRPVVIDRDAHLDPRFKSFPNLPEDEYESILAVPVLARDKLAGALNVRTRLPRVFAADEIALLSAIAGQVGQAIENAKLYERSQQRVVELEALADVGRTLSSSLYLDEALSGIAARTVRALRADGCAVVLRNDDGLSVAFREGAVPPDGQLIELAERAPAQDEVALAQELQWKTRTTGALVVCSDQPRQWSPEERSLLTTIAHAASAAVANAQAALRGLLAQEIHHRVKNNLQTVASLLRLQAGATDDEHASKALEESVNRILSIAAVHDLLTAAREDDVDCAGLIGRLEAMLGQGLGGRAVRSSLQSVTLSGQRATALALVFCELFQNSVEHGGGAISVDLTRSGDVVELVVSDEGDGPPPGAGEGLGLTIAKALVEGELSGSLEFAADGAGRAVVTFPAGS
jgi:two-component sensor histidine kinase